MAATGVEAAMDSASACADRHIKFVPRNHIMLQVCLMALSPAPLSVSAVLKPRCAAHYCINNGSSICGPIHCDGCVACCSPGAAACRYRYPSML